MLHTRSGCAGLVCASAAQSRSLLKYFQPLILFKITRNFSRFIKFFAFMLTLCLRGTCWHPANLPAESRNDPDENGLNRTGKKRAVLTLVTPTRWYFKSVRKQTNQHYNSGFPWLKHEKKNAQTRISYLIFRAGIQEVQFLSFVVMPMVVWSQKVECLSRNWGWGSAAAH